LTPSPAISTLGPLGAQRAQVADLVLGQQARVHLVDAGGARDVPRSALFIAGEHDDAPHADGGELLDRGGGLGSHRIAQPQQAGQPPVDQHRHRRLTVFAGGGDRGVGGQQPRRADHHLVALDRRLDAQPRPHLEGGRFGHRDAASDSGIDDGATEQVLGSLLGGGGQAEQGVGAPRAAGPIDGGSGIDGGESRTARGEGAGLVERDGVDRRQPLDRLAALHQHALAAESRDSGRHRRRRRPAPARRDRRR
jgi:hypothetical protein